MFLFRLVLGCALFAVLVGGANRFQMAVCAAESTPGGGQHEVVDLFPAIDAGQIEVEVIPRDSTRTNLIVSNTTDRPLAIRMPLGAVAAPVLAQFQPFPNQNNNNSPQNQGLPFQNNNNNNPFPFFNQGAAAGAAPAIGPHADVFARAPFDEQGLLNVPAGRTVRVRIPAVCLEHGRPDPGPRHAYELRPLESFSSDPRLKYILGLLATGHFSQRETQIAAWHVSSDMSWDELDTLQIEHFNGRNEQMFTAAELATARQMVETADEMVEQETETTSKEAGEE